MTYAVSSALQSAVYQRLVSDSGVLALVGGAIYDALPSGTLPSIYVSLGPEKVRDISDQLVSAAEHEFIVSVVTDQTGFSAAKAAAGAVCANADAVTTRDKTISNTMRFMTGENTSNSLP